MSTESSFGTTDARRTPSETPRDDERKITSPIDDLPGHVGGSTVGGSGSGSGSASTGTYTGAGPTGGSGYGAPGTPDEGGSPRGSADTNPAARHGDIGAGRDLSDRAAAGYGTTDRGLDRASSGSLPSRDATYDSGRDSALDSRADANRDPLTGAPGSHPVGTGIGAAVGGVATGAAVGSIAGPVGTLVGAAIGAVVGGLAGKGIAETLDPTAEDAYWRENYSSRPYIDANTSYDDYGPAYGYGVEAYTRHGGRRFEEVENDLGRDWDSHRRTSSLSWDRAKHATRDAWHRASDTVERAVPGDSDRDGK